MKSPVTRGWSGELATWAVVGFSAGVAAGFLLGEVVGSSGARRLVRLVRGLRAPAAHPMRRSGILSSVRAALRADVTLAGLSPEVSLGPGGRLELRGWVNTRRQRTHAHRLAQDTAGAAVLNRLLVRGEDDRQAFTTAPDESPRSA